MSKGHGIQAGKLRHRLTIQQRVESRDEIGGVAFNWSDLVTRFGSIVAAKGSEITSGDQQDGRQSSEIRIRYYDQLDSTMRIIHKTKIFNIVSIIDIDERNKVMTIAATQDTNKLITFWLDDESNDLTDDLGNPLFN